MTFLAQEQGDNGAALAMGCGVPQTQGISPMGGSQPSQYPPSTPKDLGPWREQGLAVAMGQVAGGVTQQAGLVWVVSHCQLSLPGWDCHSHLAPQWLHWEHQTISRHEKTPLCPKSSPPAWGGSS